MAEQHQQAPSAEARRATDSSGLQGSAANENASGPTIAGNSPGLSGLPLSQPDLTRGFAQDDGSSVGNSPTASPGGVPHGLAGQEQSLPRQAGVTQPRIAAAEQPTFPASSSSPSGRGMNFVLDVPVELTIQLGRRNMRIADVLRLGPGSILELDKVSGEPLDILVNDRLIARGEAVVVGERYGVRLTEVFVEGGLVEAGQ
ncbi:MAG: flagellar motor switch protein FliN [Polyangiaceae bacterium]|nr:flagellar motor switch protein FliN [Polyangiaceae bacterium]